ncbi:MAG: hypothetical protein LBE04_05040 [Prevotellaceae bacterium]|jgi:hypothetical protein|nr:hypothetical protein [Prevotellaceae bacterium]
MNKEVIQTLKEDAVSKGLCATWESKFKQEMSIETLARMYMKGIDFCISSDYPTLAFLRKEFKGICEPYGIFIDDKVMVTNIRKIVLNGDCRAFLEYDKYTVAQVFVRHTSKASINVSEHSIVTVDAFDDTELVVAVSGGADVSVNLYGNAKIECIGIGAKVKFMQRETY